MRPVAPNLAGPAAVALEAALFSTADQHSQGLLDFKCLDKATSG
jgi:2-oxo-4-hydroxy-4-carboxy--5-ureidoimidazoline (OHCU) decarboxylase